MRTTHATNIATTLTIAAALTTSLGSACSTHCETDADCTHCEADADCAGENACIAGQCAENKNDFAAPGMSFILEEEGDGIIVEPCPSSPGVGFRRNKPNVMFLVDRSSSMNADNKWEQLLALGPYLETVKGHARFGLSVFPGLDSEQDSCSTSSGLLVPLSEASNIDEVIVGSLTEHSPAGQTPIAAALDQVRLNGGLDDAERDNIVVLLTDGEPNCACTDGNGATCEHDEAVAAVQRLHDANVPVRVNVIGFGNSATDAGPTLSDLAEAGGTARPGEVKYFEARSVDELVARLFELTAAAAPCRFALDDFPEPEDLKVHFDETILSECTEASCSSGYTYDQVNGTVEFKGASCQALRDGQCHDVWFDG